MSAAITKAPAILSPHFQAVKSAANAVFSQPTVTQRGETLFVTVESTAAGRFPLLCQRLAAKLPGVTFAEMDATRREECKVAMGSQFLPIKQRRVSFDVNRRALVIYPPQPPLTEQEIFNVLDYILTHVDPREIRRTLYFFGFTVESFLEALAARQDVSSVLTSLFDALIIDENQARPLKEDFSAQTQAQFVFAVQTRRDGAFYRTVSDVFNEYFLE